MTARLAAAREAFARLIHRSAGLAHLITTGARLADHHRLAALIIGAVAGLALAFRRRRPRQPPPPPAPSPARSNGTGVAVAGTAVAAAIAYGAWLAKHPGPAAAKAAAPRPVVTQKIIHRTVVEHVAAPHGGIQGWQIVVVLLIMFVSYVVLRLNGRT